MGQLVGPAAPPRSPPSSSSIRSTSTSTSARRTCSASAPNMAKRGMTIAGPEEDPGRGRPADRGRAIRTRARSTTPRPTSTPPPARSPSRAVLPNADRGAAARLFRARARAARRRSRTCCWCPTAPSAPTRAGRYVLVAGKDDVVEQRTVEIGQLVGDLRVITQGHHGRRPRRRLRHADGGSRQKIEPQLKTLTATPRTAPRNDLQILHRAAGAGERHRHPDGGHRHRLALRLPVAQYPNVVPPTVSVTTRYPGASARTVIDTVALPIEQQVNGVEDMIYMQSFAAADGSYTLTVTFAIGTDLERSAGAGAEPRVGGHGGAAAIGAGAGRQRPEEVDRDPRDRHADLARRQLRQPLSSPTTPPSG